MANSILLDRQGPDWPLGLITVAASGTPVNIMHNVDPNNNNNPNNPNTNLAGVNQADEYAFVFQQIFFQAIKSVAPVVVNTGAIYILRAGVTPGLGNKTDSGALVWTLQPGANLFLGSAPLNRNVISPYRYFIDADNAGDGCIVTGLVQ